MLQLLVNSFCNIEYGQVGCENIYGGFNYFVSLRITRCMRFASFSQIPRFAGNFRYTGNVIRKKCAKEKYSAIRGWQLIYK